MRLFLKLTFGILWCVLVSCCLRIRTPITSPPEVVAPIAEPKVSIAVLWDTDTIYVFSKNLYSAISQGKATTLSAHTNLVVIYHKDSILILKSNQQRLLSSPDQIIFESPTEISIGYSLQNMTPYHNRIVIKKNVIHRFAVKKKLTAINIVSLEKYLYGVVSCEMGMAKEIEIEALKAQAVAARSYTMTLLGKRKDFDIYNSYLYDQEYKGLLREYPLAMQAVNLTRGEIIKYQDEVILAQYHACCGGVTTNGRYPYLRSIIDAPHHSSKQKPYCQNSPHFQWTTKFTRQQFQDTLLNLANVKYKFDFIPKLDINKTTRRVEHLHFTGLTEYKISGDAIRKALNLKSTQFTLKMTKDTVEINGFGWGHGIGLCQYGALEMARQKKSYQDILKHYYAEIKIVKTY
ncbi:MAG: SpoIID/LytB domain-containing protein [candidate division WOR-3 bacterium]